jgi:hypothetical protein
MGTGAGKTRHMPSLLGFHQREIKIEKIRNYTKYEK